MSSAGVALTICAMIYSCQGQSSGASVGGSQSEWVTFSGGPAKAHNFVEFSKVQREFYVVGFIDGLYMSPILHGDSDGTSVLEKCVEGMDADQIAEIILKRIRNTPENWHYPLNGEAFAAIRLTCPALAQYMKDTTYK